MPTDNENGVALVARGYNEDTRCLSFRVAFDAYGDGISCAASAAGAIGDYNDYDGVRVANALLRIKPDYIRYPGIEVGRESSPVIYVTLRPDCPPEKRNAIENALREAKADELDWESDTLRAWWD
jgi:hypothetical protein